MPRFIDLTGRTFGLLRVDSLVRGRRRGSKYWLCHCECGTLSEIRGQRLREGVARDCGCRLVPRIHSTVNGKQTREYRSYRGMLARCGDPAHPFYQHYGGRGIRVCDRWRAGFVAFREDMGDRPTGTSLDRVDPNGDYEPSNCRWATRVEQARNTRSTKRVTIGGTTLTLPEWKAEFGLQPTDCLSAASLTAVVRYFGVEPKQLQKASA